MDFSVVFTASSTCAEEKMVNNISENPCEGEEYTGVKQLTNDILRSDESKKQSYEEEDGRESENEVLKHQDSNCEDVEDANTPPTSDYEENVISFQENIDDIGKNSYLVNHFDSYGNESPAENQNEIIAKENRDDQYQIEEDTEVATDSGHNYLISAEEDESTNETTKQFENDNWEEEELKGIVSPENNVEDSLENQHADENDESGKGSEIVNENRKNYLFLTQEETEESPEDSDADSGLQTEDDDNYYVDVKKGTIAEKENGVDDEFVSKPDAVNQELRNFDSCSNTEMQITSCFEDSTKFAPNNNLSSDTQDVDETTSKELSMNDKRYEEGTSPAQCMETQPTESRELGDGQVQFLDGGAMQMINSEQVPTVQGGSIQMIDGGEMRMDGGSVQMINGGQMQMTGGGSVQTINSGHMQMMDAGSVQMVHGGQVQMMDGGSVQMINSGQVQMVDSGSVQMVDGGQMQMTDAGSFQMAQGGQEQMMNEGSVQMINGGQLQMVDGRQVQMMDAGSIQMINGRQVQMVDGGQMQMMDAGSFQMVNGGQVQMMDGGSVQMITAGQEHMIDSGSVQMVDGGQVQMMDAGSVQMVDSGQLQMIGGNSGQITEVTTVECTNDIQALEMSSQDIPLDSQFSTQQVSSQHEAPLADSLQIQQISSIDENSFDSQFQVCTVYMIF